MRRQRSPEEADPEGEAGEEEQNPGCSGSDEESLGREILHDGPVPRVRMDYFYRAREGQAEVLEDRPCPPRSCRRS